MMNFTVAGAWTDTAGDGTAAAAGLAGAALPAGAAAASCPALVRSRHLAWCFASPRPRAGLRPWARAGLWAAFPMEFFMPGLITGDMAGPTGDAGDDGAGTAADARDVAGLNTDAFCL